MSFSDFGRPATLQGSSSFEKPSSPHRRNKLPPTLRHFQTATKTEPTDDFSFRKDDGNIRTTTTTTPSRRSVRPRLETRNPVTNEPLLPKEDDDSKDNSVASSLSDHEVFEEEDSEELHDSFPPPVAPSPKRPSDSIFSALHKEIYHFQKLVTDLEQAMKDSGDSPEAQWRTRILIRSSKDAQVDLTQRFYDIDNSEKNVSRHSRGQMAMRKLRRDFSRVHKQFEAAMKTYERRQQVEVSFLACADEEQKEEFFDRAMREREEEIKNIHYSMNTVNAIYEDLAGLVDGQQEQIDKLVENIEESKANTFQGMEQIHEAIKGFCGQEYDKDAAGSSYLSMEYMSSMENFMELATSCQASLHQCADDIVK